MQKVKVEGPILKKKIQPLGKKGSEAEAAAAIKEETEKMKAKVEQETAPKKEEQSKEEDPIDDDIPGPSEGTESVANLKPLGLCPHCHQYMFRPDSGDDFCPACNPPIIQSRNTTLKGRPIRGVDAPPPAPYEDVKPKSEKVGPYTAFRGYNSLLPKKTKRGSWAFRCRQIHTGGQWNDSVTMPRDQQALIRTGVAYDEAFTKNCHLVQGIASLDLDGQDCLIATKHEILFNSNIIEVDGEACLAFYLHGAMAKIKQGDFVAEIVPLAVLPT